MKRLAWIIAILVVAGIFCSGNVFADGGGTFKVAALKGKVLIKKAGTQDWVEAKVGDVLNNGDSIKTLGDGSVYIESGPNSGFTLGPNSEFSVGNSLEPPPVAEPYTEAGGDRAGNVVAPEANQDGAASGY